MACDRWEKEQKALLRVKGGTRVKQETTQRDERFVTAAAADYFVTAASVLGSTTSPRCVMTWSTMP